MYNDRFVVIAFFDNGKATRLEGIELCSENFHLLYDYPSKYDYSLFDENTITYSKREDNYATGLNLSANYWAIKDFEEIIEIEKCDN